MVQSFPFPYRRSPPGNPVPSVVERHDARAFGRPYAADGFQGNLLAQQQRRNDIAREGVVPIDELIENLDARFLPLQVVQSTNLEFIKEFGVKGARLLIHKSQTRWAFSIGNFTGANLMIMCYGKPVDVGQGVGAGLPIGGCFNEQNTEISIDDIWVFCNDPAETYPIPIVGFEGGIAISGNRR